jgi:hypothetical protein
MKRKQTQLKHTQQKPVEKSEKKKRQRVMENEHARYSNTK